MPSSAPPRPKETFVNAPKNSNAGLKPSKVSINKRTHYYQIPERPRGTVFVFPGCVRTGYGFWPYDARGCPECAGLPEDVAHVKQALARGYAICVFTAGGKSHCWWAATDSDFVKNAIPQFISKFPQLKGKPVYVMGASSGGGIMQRTLGGMGAKIDGVIALVSTSSEVPEIIKGLRGAKPPPIVWITMAEDKEKSTARQLAAEYKKYAPSAVASTERHKIIPTYFSDRISLVTPQQSAQIADQMLKLKMIKSDGTLVADPKEPRAWLRRLQLALPFLRTKDFQIAPMEKAVLLQVMMVAQAKHDHVCDYMTAALAWLETGGKANFDVLAKKYQVVKPALLTMARQVDGSEPTPAQAFAYGVAGGAGSQKVPANETAAAVDGEVHEKKKKKKKKTSKKTTTESASPALATPVVLTSVPIITPGGYGASLASALPTPAYGASDASDASDAAINIGYGAPATSSAPAGGYGEPSSVADSGLNAYYYPGRSIMAVTSVPGAPRTLFP